MRVPCVRLLTIVLAFAAPRGLAAAAAEPSTAELFTRSELVFEGTVSKIRYGLSRIEKKGDRRVPLTFVTFTVGRVLAGAPSARTVTLRFLGGPLENGKVLVASELPAFDVGDRDLLFVAGNGFKACPLVGCAGGRIRLVRGYAYTDDGAALALAGTELRRGRVHDLQEVDTHTIAGHVFRARRGGATLDAGAPAPVQTKDAPSLDEKKLLDWAAQRTLALRDAKRPARKVAEPTEDVVVRISPVAPPGALSHPRREVTP
jgi:hypothetical protein